MRRYFKGLLIEWWFGGLSHFDEVYINTNATELRTFATYQLIGEQVLQIEVDGVHIPYEGDIRSEGDEDEQSQQRNSPNKEKSDVRKASDKNDADRNKS